MNRLPTPATLGGTPPPELRTPRVIPERHGDTWLRYLPGVAGDVALVVGGQAIVTDWVHAYALYACLRELFTDPLAETRTATFHVAAYCDPPGGAA